MSDTPNPTGPGVPEAAEPDSDGADTAPSGADTAPAERRKLGPARKAAIGVGVVFLGLLIVLAIGVNGRDDVADGRSFLLGERVPVIAGTDVLTGDEFDIQQVRGQWTVVNFFGTWCPGCLVEHPELVSFESWADANGVAMVSLVVGEPGERAAAFFAEEGGTWNVVLDGRASIDFGVAQLPETFIVAPDGTVVAHLTGSVTEAQLRSSIPL